MKPHGVLNLSVSLDPPMNSSSGRYIVLQGQLSQTTALVVSGCLLLLSSITSLVTGHFRGVHSRQSHHSVSLGAAVPDYFPTELPDTVLTPENTVHFQIYPDSAAEEWASIFPPGDGFVQFGTTGEIFGVALFHQMHCLGRIREAMASRKSTIHVHHCFNYLRQIILCEANPTIEPVIPIIGRRSVNAEVPRVCKDWTQVYRVLETGARGNSTM
ncbi:hypothetical protein DFH07DRAFT_900913 [Mycena maculata]|uniref:Uncharacterized protein n=1 Tax=Mycena maculata TaxID=230809 RepID=A0AAD7KCH2_9AGAR|nr:hypothetical protein DFH07DRAFT_900913 [Mycena maculata]